MQARAMRGTGVRRILDADDGLTLIELMVAISVMLIVLAGIAAGAMSGLRLAGSNTNRIVAANLADELISDTRAMDFADVPQGLTTGTRTLGGITYEWTRQAEMVFLGATESACDAPPAPPGTLQPAYLRVAVDVSWNEMRGVDPVRSETLIDPPIADYSDPYSGHLAVKVTDRDGRPVPGMTVRLENADAATPAINTFKATSTEGCAFFDNLPVIPGETRGNYHVWLNEPGWVDRATGLTDTSQQTPRPVVPVLSADLTKREFNYDRGATLDVTPVGAQGGTPPADVSITIANDNYNGGNGPVVFADAAALAAQLLHPFPAGFSLWTGRCVDSDPGADERTRLPTDPGVTTTGDVMMSTLDVTVVDDDDPGDPDDGGPVAGATIEVEDACGTVHTLSDAPTDASGQTRLALPYGDWTVRVAGASPAGAWPTVSLTAGAAAPASVLVTIDG